MRAYVLRTSAALLAATNCWWVCDLSRLLFGEPIFLPCCEVTLNTASTCELCRVRCVGVPFSPSPTRSPVVVPEREARHDGCRPGASSGCSKRST